MKTTRWILVAALALGLAGSASAASKGTLTATNNTLAGPGTVAIAAGGTAHVFTQAGGNSDVCATVVNTGRASVTVNVTGEGEAAGGDVPAGGTGAVCTDDATDVNVVCAGESDCAVQWRVDDI